MYLFVFTLIFVLFVAADFLLIFARWQAEC